MRTIEIDFDIHKLIEAERRGFDEPANDALRRLLKLPKADSSASGQASRSGVPAKGDGHQPWQAEGVILPHGTKLRMVYGRPKKKHEGQIINGEWVVGGQTFDSPSGAASGVAVTAKGEKTRLNGWELWDVQRPDESRWTPISKLRGKELTLQDMGWQ
jgi:hypothetical protein